MCLETISVIVPRKKDRSMEDEHGQRQVSRNPLEKGFVKIWDAGVTIDRPLSVPRGQSHGIAIRVTAYSSDWRSPGNY